MVARQHYRWDFIGLSTDNKPTPTTSEKVVDGSTFYCSDNSKLYVWYKTQWYEKTVSGGGGGTDNFNALTNRPKYNGSLMSGDTDIPEVITYTAGDNITITNGEISATNTTYSNFTGTDGTAAGAAGLVPAPATTDAGKFLKADGTWDTAGGSGPTVVQTTGTSQTDVMSQNATTSMVFADPATKRQIQIGDGATASGTSCVALGPNTPAGTDAPKATGTGTVAIGAYGTANNDYSIAIAGTASANGAIAIGWGSQATAKGQFDISTHNTGYGYGNSLYRLISGVHDPVNAHDAATKGYVDGKVLTAAGAPTTATVGTVGQLYEDSTNGKLYQCTAVDTTDPQNPSYTWSEVGGGSITPVQTPGTSTTDVMSQNAATSMIYADPGDLNRVRIGKSAQAINNESVVIGTSASSNSSRATALGAQTKANGDYNTAVGYAARLNTVNKAYGTAIGPWSQVDESHSVALGSYSHATQQGQVDISTTLTTNTYGYNNSQYRLLTGLYDGQSAHDAATVGQITPLTDSAAPTTATVGRLGQIFIDTTNADAYMCVVADTVTPAYTWKKITP